MLQQHPTSAADFYDLSTSVTNRHTPPYSPNGTGVVGLSALVNTSSCSTPLTLGGVGCAGGLLNNNTSSSNNNHIGGGGHGGHNGSHLGQQQQLDVASSGSGSLASCSSPGQQTTRCGSVGMGSSASGSGAGGGNAGGEQLPSFGFTQEQVACVCEVRRWGLRPNSRGMRRLLQMNSL